MIDFNKNTFGPSIMPAIPMEDMPERSGDIPVVSIHEQLAELGMPVESISVGLFDMIGEYTAKKQRGQDSENFRKYGAFFRPNYERGMLIAALIRKYRISSYLEIGFGRGYSTLCAAMAMHEAGIAGKVVTVDPNFDETHMANITKIFPPEWLRLIDLERKTSDEYFAQSKDKFEMIYIDGDHRYQAVLRDWHNSKDRAEKIILFDDYHLPGKRQKDMEVANVVDAIQEYDKKLIKMDRRIFFDDRRMSYEELDYGQVLIVKE